jgi:hypothetical protein
VVICGLRCSLCMRTAALLSHNSLPLATVLSGVLHDIHFNFYRKKQ